MLSVILLHSSGATDIPWLGLWNLAPLRLVPFAAISVAYALGVYQISRNGSVRNWSGWYVAAFYAGLAASLVALLGPLDTYNDDSFTMHMAQHIVLLQLAAPLLLLGRPVQLALRTIPRRISKTALQTVHRRPALRTALTSLTAPLSVILIFNLNLAGWHLPAAYNAALRNDLIHEMMHVSFFLTGLLFWWPIIDPVPRHHRFHPAATLATLGFAALNGKIIGGILISSGSVIYGYYEQRDMLWGISPLSDQHLGAGLMLTTGVIVYAGLFFVVLARTLLNATPEMSARKARVSRARADVTPGSHEVIPGTPSIDR